MSVGTGGKKKKDLSIHEGESDPFLGKRDESVSPRQAITRSGGRKPAL